jgi:hypothetical protein
MADNTCTTSGQSYEQEEVSSDSSFMKVEARSAVDGASHLEARSAVDASQTLDIRQSEAEVQARLGSVLGAGHKSGVTGTVDIWTEDMIFEIKDVRNWTQAIGQVAHYATEYPNHRKIVYLFGKWTDKFSWPTIQETCRNCGVEVMRDDLHYAELKRYSSGKKGCTLQDITQILSQDIIPTTKLGADATVFPSDYAGTQEQLTQVLKYIIKSLSTARLTLRPEIMTPMFEAYEKLREDLVTLQALVERLNDKSIAAEAFIEEMVEFSLGKTVRAQDLKTALHDWCEENEYKTYTKYLEHVEKKLNARSVFKQRGRTCYEWAGIVLHDRPQIAKP